MRRRTKSLVGICGVVLLSTVAVSASAQLSLPLQPGQAVATCRSGFNGMQAAPFVVGIIDTRDPICNAPGVDQNWSAPMYHNEAAISPTMSVTDEWSVSNLGQVFGIALDDAPNPNIYVTSTSTYGGADNALGNVYKLDGTTGAVSVLATLPGTGPGLGQIAYDRTNQQLFVTNHEDGIIYRLAMDGTLLQTFDPFGADDGAAGFAPLGERLFGIQAYGCHVYFGRWTEHYYLFGKPAVWVGNGPNEVYSLELDTNGAMVGPEVLQLTVPAKGNGHTMPIADIAFSANGDMMLAEKGMWDDGYSAPHQGRLLEYTGGHGAWVPSGNTYEVGQVTGPNNSTGGVDYDCAVADQCNAGGHVFATGDALKCCSAPNNIYGLQVLPAGGGTLNNSYLIDLDNETNFQDKTAIGDVDAVRNCFAVPPECPVPNDPCDNDDSSDDDSSGDASSDDDSSGDASSDDGSSDDDSDSGDCPDDDDSGSSGSGSGGGSSNGSGGGSSNGSGGGSSNGSGGSSSNGSGGGSANGSGGGLSGGAASAQKKPKCSVSAPVGGTMPTGVGVFFLAGALGLSLRRRRRSR